MDMVLEYSCGDQLGMFVLTSDHSIKLPIF